jgi:hypothetical protein
MNIIRSLLASSLVAAAAASSAFAATSLDRPAHLPAPFSAAPIPTKVVHPTELPARYRNITVTVEFTLDQYGFAHNVAPIGDMPKDLAARLLPAIAQWEFTPCRDLQGNPISKKVIMPVTLVEGRI